MSAIVRPSELSCTAQLPPTAASVAIAANVSAMPSSSGSVLLRERLVAAREDERQDGQHAGAEDRQHAAQKCQKGQ